MLTQDDFVAPNMSGDANLQRSSWKAEAIRRGDLKISGPIPITEETPLNDDEEREYAEKYHIEPPLVPQDTSTQQAQSQQTPPQIQAKVHDEPRPQTAAQVELRPQPREEHHGQRPKTSLSGAQQTSDMQRGSSVEPAPYSSPSPFPSIPESSIKTAPKKKRKSGLRNVFRKMFGRRSRDETQEEDETVHRGHGHHVSDPGLLRKSSERRRENPSAPRISDLPVRELEPINPLGQHLPFPMNVNAPQEASPPHEYLTFEMRPPELGRRRATLPSLHLANNEARSWSGSKERLTTWDERQEGDIPSPQIGIALSSPPHTTHASSIQSKRRSRSAGALRDLAKYRPSIERRRSAEIRYWRNSYASGSIYSTNTPRPQTARTVDTVRTVDTRDTQETTTKPEDSIAESRAAQAPIVAQHNQDISEIPIPVEAFNFGNLKSGFSDDEDSETPAVPSRSSEKRLSIEERVKHLEDHMRTLESSVRRISGRSNRQTIILENAPKGRRSRNRSSSAHSERQSSHHSSRSTLQGQNEPESPDSPVLAPLSAVNEFPGSTDHRQTVIALEQRPSISQRSELAEQFAAIYEALKHERCARKTLEKQVTSLQREVTDLHAIVNKLMVSASPSYPTPSPDNIITSNEERLSTPRASIHPDLRGTKETIITSHFGRRDSEGEDVSVSSSQEDITSPEAWATPKEESGSAFGSGFFHSSRSRSDLKEGEDEMF